MTFTISIGNSRKDKYWKLQHVTWEAFIDRLSRTIVTSETQDEYRRMKKYKQDDLKDVGGFVGGELKDGLRRKESVLNRSMLTLDMDYANSASDIAENLEMLYDFSCCLYSTHKHTPEHPRLRLIIPLSRVVSPDEYQAVGRKLAKEIGIEFFDDTTYEPNRLMYWPSTSLDGEYYFKVIEGKWLDPDSILGLYANWHDSSTWPVSARQLSFIKRQMKKLEDPESKGGMVGAFCRTYSIEEAIKLFLSEIYEPSITSNRYDYIPANSSAGVVIYDGKFAYSHHATDPACGRLLNAFDLIRIHLFGELDEDADETKPLPSFRAMVELCTEDQNVRRSLAMDREQELQVEFESFEENDDIPEEEEDLRVGNEESDIDLSWQMSLVLNKNGSVKDTPTNILKIFKNDPRLKAISYNQMTHLIDVKGSLPWRQLKPGWNDADLAHLKMYFDKYYKIWAPIKIKDALLSAASERAFHPVKEYLESLAEWDGTQRLDTLLIDYLGAEDNQYTRAIMRKTLTAAVARIYEPGTKFDYVLVLNGPQGIGKSTFFSKLGGKWFSDSLTVSDMRDKAGAEKLQGYWILELGELAGLRKMDVETVKSFITRTDDKFRQSYGINVENHPRQCVVVGSTNSLGGFLRDITGNRRFWPVRVNGGLKSIWNITDVEQIWAETLIRYRAGESLILSTEEESIAIEEQRSALESDDREGLIMDYLEMLIPENWDNLDLFERRNFLAGQSEFGAERLVGTKQREKVCIHEIWCECFGKDKTNLRRTDSFEIIGILMRIGGWEVYSGNKQGQTRFPIYGNQKTYLRVLVDSDIST